MRLAIPRWFRRLQCAAAEEEAYTYDERRTRWRQEEEESRAWIKTRIDISDYIANCLEQRRLRWERLLETGQISAYEYEQLLLDSRPRT